MMVPSRNLRGPSYFLVREKLRSERQKLGMTQAEMAQLLGLRSKNAYSLKERGDRNFSVNEAIILAHRFGISVEEIFAIQYRP